MARTCIRRRGGWGMKQKQHGMGKSSNENSKTGVKVLHIVGADRTGSTLLANALGEIDGFFCAGELWRLWESLVDGRARCGCGAYFTQCEVWSKVLDGLGNDGNSVVDPAQVFEWQLDIVKRRRIWKLLKSRPSGRSDWPEFDSYANLLSKLYLKIADVAKAKVIVDSTKLPAHAALVSRLDDIVAYPLQVIRDPRAVAYSWRRKKYRPDRMDELPTYGSIRSTVSWLDRNAFSELVRRGPGFRGAGTVRYEDFIDDPWSTLESVTSMIAESGHDLPIVERKTLKLGTNHTVMGNPSRFSGGVIHLDEDDEWKDHQGLGPRFIATSLSAPLLHRYGYKIRTRI